MSKLYYESELYHYGVKGMKWGVRKAIVTVGSGLRKLATREPAVKGGPKPMGSAPRGAKVDGRAPSQLPRSAKRVNAKKARESAANALDKLSDMAFFSDKLKNSFAVSRGLSTVSESLRKGNGIMEAAVNGLEEYKFFEDD